MIQSTALPNNWKTFDSNLELPLNISTIIKNSNGFKMSNKFIYSLTKDSNWIVVTEDGEYYKDGAKYMVWYIVNYKCTKNQALWSDKSLFNTLHSLMKTGELTKDPNYQT